uniref:Importin subunit alpha n=1 Tax=Globodera rostochiensis TaxID=31243 RepID=A0A914I2T0_GLORO
MKMILLMFNAVLLLPIIFAMPNPISLLNSETDSNATNTNIQLVNQAKSLDPNERFAAVSRICGLLWKDAKENEVAIAEFVSIGAVPVLVNCLKSTEFCG